MRLLKNLVKKIEGKFTHNKLKTSQIQRLLNDNHFLEKLLEYSCNDIDVFCCYLGDIFVYYSLTNDQNINYSIEELLGKIYGINLFTLDEIEQKGFFTHSCNGCMIENIKNNGLGSPLNINPELYAAVNFLEKNLKITGDYTKQQSGKSDEVYFTSAGASSFGYACNFAPERLFLGILRQERENSIPVTVGESKIDYYRKVLYKKFGKNINDETKKNIETVLNGYLGKQNYIISFPVNKIINSDNIYFEVVRDTNKIDLKKYIQENCSSGFFTSHTGSNSNPNNMDNFVMINTVISPKDLTFFKVPDRYDLIQLIALNKNIHQGEMLDYFSFDKIEKSLFSEQEIGKATINTSITNKDTAQNRQQKDEQQIIQENQKGFSELE